MGATILALMNLIEDMPENYNEDFQKYIEFVE